MSSNLPEDDLVTVWLHAVRATGQDAAMEEIFARYFDRLVGIARNRLSHGPAQFVDEEDVVQSALASFYFKARAGRYPNLKNRDELWRLLLAITKTKISAHNRKEGRRNENLRREFSGENFLKGEPSPEFVCDIADQLDILLDKLDDELTRRVAMLKLQSYTNQEIAQQIDKSKATVERKLRNIRAVWSEEFSDDGRK